MTLRLLAGIETGRFSALLGKHDAAATLQSA
jgi:hypothetical protein